MDPSTDSRLLIDLRNWATDRSMRLFIFENGKGTGVQLVGPLSMSSRVFYGKDVDEASMKMLSELQSEIS